MHQLEYNSLSRSRTCSVSPPHPMLPSLPDWIVHCINLSTQIWPHLFPPLTQIPLERYFYFYVPMENPISKTQDGHQAIHQVVFKSYLWFRDPLWHKQHPYLRRQLGYTEMSLKWISGCQKMPWYRSGDPEAQSEGYKFSRLPIYHTSKEQKVPNIGQVRCRSFDR